MQYSTPQEQKLAEMMRQQAYEPGDNPWFTPRVMNKLPEKRRKPHSVLAIVCYLAALVVCVLSWAWWASGSFNVITVGDIIYIASLAAITALVCLSPLVALMRRA